VSIIKSYIQNGQVTGLAISGIYRAKVLPNIPTFSETNISELNKEKEELRKLQNLNVNVQIIQNQNNYFI
jgi:hypothetical protein